MEEASCEKKSLELCDEVVDQPVVEDEALQPTPVHRSTHNLVEDRDRAMTYLLMCIHRRHCLYRSIETIKEQLSKNTYAAYLAKTEYEQLADQFETTELIETPADLTPMQDMVARISLNSMATCMQQWHDVPYVTKSELEELH